MVEASGLARQVLATLHRQRRAMLIFHLFFTLIATTLLLPAASSLMTVMLTSSGEVAVSNKQLLDFFLSFNGLLWAVTAATLLACIAFIQHAGMMVIASSHGQTSWRAAVTAIVHVVHKFPKLLKLAALQVVSHLLLAAPFALAIAGLFSWLLGNYDIYFVARGKPAVFWWFIVASAPFLLAILVLNGSLYVRWLLALPELMLDHVSVRAALKRSHRLTRGWRRRLAAKILVTAAAVAALPLLLATFFDVAGGALLGALPEHFSILIPATIILLAVYILFAFVIAFVGIGTNSMLIYCLYERAGGREHTPLPARQPHRAGVFSWSVEIGLLLFALGHAIHVFYGFEFSDDVTVIAHRGSSIKVPENTIAAMERAIEDGADYLEIDVRQTADGTPVLLHDQDLRRVAGDPRSIWQLSDRELEEIDVGSWFSPRYSAERIPRLEEILALNEEIGLLLEIKTGPETPDLVATTMAVLRAHAALDRTIIGGMHTDILREARVHAPGIRTALFIHTGIGAPERLDFDGLGLRAATVSGDDVAAARRGGYALYVWTVNDRAAMSRFIDMGVDGIITDRPELLVALLEKRATLSDAELLVIKIRNWLRH